MCKENISGLTTGTKDGMPPVAMEVSIQGEIHKVDSLNFFDQPDAVRIRICNLAISGAQVRRAESIQRSVKATAPGDNLTLSQ